MSISESFHYYTPADFKMQAVRAILIPILICYFLRGGILISLVVYFALRAAYHFLMSKLFKMHTL